MKNYNCIVLLGPTASGKTRAACSLAKHIRGEIISADSRQVYKGLDIGTGKDLDEYIVQGEKIPYHLINIAEPGEQFYLHQFIQQLHSAFDSITARGKWPVICGGSGLYLDALHKDFSLTQIPENETLRKELLLLANNELLKKLQQFPAKLVEQVDTSSKKRIIRGIEVATYLEQHPGVLKKQELPYKPIYFGIDTGLTERRKRISERLKQRLENGMIEEAQDLLKNGLSHSRMQQLGLEYKFLSLFLQHQISREELFVQLQTAIFQFARRQMTWFRKMEKEGVKINWLSSADSLENILGTLRPEGILPKTFT